MESTHDAPVGFAKKLKNVVTLHGCLYLRFDDFNGLRGVVAFYKKDAVNVLDDVDLLGREAPAAQADRVDTRSR